MVPQSHTPTLPLYKATRTVSLFFPHIVRLLRHRMSPYSYHRATIGYQRHVVFLKSTRGLHDLALLLRNPGREFHVCELAGQVIGRPLVFGKGGRATDAWQGGLLSDAGPILDAQAKAEYKRRLDDLRRDI